MNETAAALLNARYIAISTAEAKGLTKRLLEASHDKTPGVRRLFSPILYRYWHRNREAGWALIEKIANGTVRFPGLLDKDALEILGSVSMPILNECRQEPDQLNRLAAIWAAQMSGLFGSPLARTARMLGRSWVLKVAANSFADMMRKQPSYQPVNHKELEATFSRPDAFRTAWAEALACLEQPQTPPDAIERTLMRTELTFDLYLMLVCERALIQYGVLTDPPGTIDLLERLFHQGCRWFRHSILYALFHILMGLPSVEHGWFDRYNALALEFFTAGSWRLQTEAGLYVMPGHIANADVVAARHGRPATVVPELMQRAIAAKDEAQITALFMAIDGVAFYHNEGALALSMLERALELGGKQVEPQVIIGLANIRLLNQPLFDSYIEKHRSFAVIDPAAIAATPPSITEEDLLTLIDGFIIYTMLTSEGFRSQLCRAFRRALAVRTVEEFMIQLLEWVRDEVSVRKRG